MSCKRISKKAGKVCIGDLNTKIKIQVSKIMPPEGESVDYTKDFFDVKEVWAMVDTTRGSQMFDGVSITNPFTHLFYIRYLTDGCISSENWVEYCNTKYDIVDIENLGENDEFLLLRCIKKGSKTIKANV